MRVKDQSTFIMIFENIKKDTKAKVYTTILFDAKILINKITINKRFFKKFQGLNKIQLVLIQNYYQIKWFQFLKKKNHISQVMSLCQCLK